METLGTEWLIEAMGCRPDALRDVKTLATLFDCVIAELQLRPVTEPVWHQFPGDTTYRTYLTSPDLYSEPRFTNYALATTGAEPFPHWGGPLPT